MHAEEILIPMSFFATVFGLFFLRSKENMAMIDKGVNPRKNHGGPNPYAYMKYALLLVGAGIGLFLAYIVDVAYLSGVIADMNANGNHHDRDNPVIYLALLTIGGGLGLFSAYKLERKRLDKQHTHIDTDKSEETL